jgi:hypothetical protein
VPVIVVTRLHLKDHSYQDEFFASAVALLEQARGSAGILGSDVMAEPNDTWWTCTAWPDRAVIKSYVGTDPHLTAMSRLDDWCDEASFVDWDQDAADLPDWQTAFRHLVADGTSADLQQPSPANATRAFTAPGAPVPPS